MTGYFAIQMSNRHLWTKLSVQFTYPNLIKYMSTSRLRRLVSSLSKPNDNDGQKKDQHSKVTTRYMLHWKTGKIFGKNLRRNSFSADIWRSAENISREKFWILNCYCILEVLRIFCTSSWLPMDKLIAVSEFNRKLFYISNILRCYPSRRHMDQGVSPKICGKTKFVCRKYL